MEKKKSIKILNIGTDYLLAILLVLILVSAFIFTLSLSPLTFDDIQNKNDVLGTSTGGELEINKIAGTNNYRINKYSEEGNIYSLELEPNKRVSGTFAADIFNLANKSDINKQLVIRISGEIDPNTLITLTVSNKEKAINIENGVWTEYLVELQSGRTANINLSYTNQELGLAGSNIFIEIERLP